jgi:hypothetical protein
MKALSDWVGQSAKTTDPEESIAFVGPFALDPSATHNPFDVKYSRVEDANWETCSSVLNKVSMKEIFSKGWERNRVDPLLCHTPS